MDNEEIQGVKFSEFPSETPESADEVVGIHSGNNARFSLANIVLLVRQGLANIFVPNTRKVNNKALSSDITLDASDVGARPSSWTPSASDVGAVPATAVGSADGVASLGNDGKVPSSQLDLSGMQNTITASGILKGDGAGGVSAAVAGTDYGTYSKPSGGIPATDLASGVIPSVPSAYTSNPAMDGTASPGSSGSWAKGDHVHPSDTSKANETELAPVENGTTASRAYAVGEYFCHNGKTCRAKTAISSGATLTLNTNYEEVPGGGFNELKSAIDAVPVETTSGKKAKLTVESANGVGDITITSTAPDTPTTGRPNIVLEIKSDGTIRIFADTGSGYSLVRTI